MQSRVSYVGRKEEVPNDELIAASIPFTLKLAHISQSKVIVTEFLFVIYKVCL